MRHDDRISCDRIQIVPIVSSSTAPSREIDPPAALRSIRSEVFDIGPHAGYAKKDAPSLLNHWKRAFACRDVGR